MTTTQLQPGIHPNLGMREYHAWTLDKSKLIEGPISASMLCEFFPNPFAWVRTEKQVTAAMRKGSLYDLAITDPDALDESTALMEFDDFKTKAAREWRDETIAAGKLIVTKDDLERAKNAAAAVRSHKIAGEILDGCDFQTAAVGDIGGIPAKCLIDIVPNAESDWNETLVDYKTTSNGLGDDEIRKAIGSLKYHWRAAFYRTLFNKAAKDRLCEDFAFVFQDINTNEVRVVKLAPDALALGTRMVGEAVKEFSRCAHKGIGSRYAKSCDALDLPTWAAMSEDEFLEKGIA